MNRPSASKRVGLLGVGAYTVIMAMAPGTAGAAVPTVYTGWCDSVTAVSRQEATAAALDLPVRDTIMLPGNVPLVMVLVPAGRYLMGSPSSEDGHEGDEQQRSWTIPQPFYVSETAVTQRQYRAVVGADSLPPGTSTYRPEYTARMYFGYSRRVFCPKLAAYAPQDWHFAMVTAAQMEYATRAGMGTQWFSGTGTDLESFGASVWYAGNSGGVEHPVRLKNPNHWGLYDMLGNVWTFIDEYLFGGMTPSTGFGSPDDALNAFNIVKGGAFDEPALDNGCRSANHNFRSHGQALRLAMNCTKDLMTPTPALPDRRRTSVPRRNGSSVAGDRIVIRSLSVKAGYVEFISLGGRVTHSLVETGLQRVQAIRFTDLGLTPGSYLMRVRSSEGLSEAKIHVH